MTKEEAHSELYNAETEYGLNPLDVFDVINKIFSDLEIKICKNCEYYKNNECMKLVYFTNGGYTNEYMSMESSDGCNKWKGNK